MRYLRFLLFSFDGRISRRHFWIGTVISTLLTLVAATVGGVFDILLGTPAYFYEPPPGFLPLSIFFTVISWLPGGAVAVKRLHDRDKRAKWLIIQIIPLLGSLWLYLEMGFFPGMRGPNGWGPDPKAPPQIAEAASA